MCPGWTVRDVVEHTAEVYEHKIACIGPRDRRPEPWPPVWPQDRGPLAWFATRTCGWSSCSPLPIRRHRPGPGGRPIRLPAPGCDGWRRRRPCTRRAERLRWHHHAGRPALAVDGIDEVLHLMLAGDWSDDPQPGSTGNVLVASPSGKVCGRYADDHAACLCQNNRRDTHTPVA